PAGSENRARGSGAAARPDGQGGAALAQPCGRGGGPAERGGHHEADTGQASDRRRPPPRPPTRLPPRTAPARSPREDRWATPPRTPTGLRPATAPVGSQREGGWAATPSTWSACADAWPGPRSPAAASPTRAARTPPTWPAHPASRSAR